jgi:hypothetical protein
MAGKTTITEKTRERVAEVVGLGLSQAERRKRSASRRPLRMVARDRAS